MSDATAAKLAAALSKAQARCKAVPHDAKNEFHKYRYTSAEAVIAEGKEALAVEGLALLPTGQSVKVDGGPETLRFELVRRFSLLHTSGEERPIEWTWPVVPDRGRPLDKAVAGAATTSLAYLIRDLLLMPRVDEADDLAGREERELPRQQKPRQQQPPPPRADLKTRCLDYESRLVAKGACKPGELMAYVASMADQDGYDVADWSKWQDEAAEAYGAAVKSWGEGRLASMGAAANGR